MAVELALKLADPPAAGDPAAADVIRSGALVVWLLRGREPASLLIALRARGMPARWFAGLALALVVVDLLRAGVGYNPSIPDDHAEQPADRCAALPGRSQPAALRGGRRRDIPQNVAALRFRLQTRAATTRRSSSATTASGGARYRPRSPADLDARLHEPIPPGASASTSGACARCGCSGVAHLLVAPESAGPPPEGLDTRGLARVYNGPDAQVFRVDGRAAARVRGGGAAARRAAGTQRSTRSRARRWTRAAWP